MLSFVLIVQLSVILVVGSHLISHFSSLPLVNTADAQVDEAFKTYKNQKFGLTVSYPPDWSVDELRKDPMAPSNNSIVVVLKSPSQGQNDKYPENVIINIQGPKSEIVSFENYTQKTLKDFNNVSDTIKITKSSEAMLAGLPAHQLEYTSTGVQGLNLKKMQVFTVVNNNTAYVVTYGAEEPEYQKNLDNIEKLINSIKIDRFAMKNIQVD